jgi:hypothetical protein
LHRDKPWRWSKWRNGQRFFELLRKLSWFLHSQICFEFFTFVVSEWTGGRDISLKLHHFHSMRQNSRLPKLGHIRLALELEESIVQFLVIDVDLAHLRLHPLPCLLLEGHVAFLFFDGVSLVGDTSICDPCYCQERGIGWFVSMNNLIKEAVKALATDSRGSWNGGFSIPRLPAR